MVPCAEGPPVIESNRLATGSVTSCVTRSTGPKMSAPTFRAGEAPPSLKSSVISDDRDDQEHAKNQAGTPVVVHSSSSSVRRGRTAGCLERRWCQRLVSGTST